MTETFEKKLKRIGYNLIDNEAYEEVTIKPSNSKILTGIILVIVGFSLTPFYKLYTSILLSVFDNSIEYSTDLIDFSFSTIGTFVSIASLYKGLHRIFDFTGFKISLSDDKISYAIRRDLNLQKVDFLKVSKFDFQSTNNNSTMSCIDSSGIKHELISEKESILDTKEVLNQLTQRLNQKLK